MHKKISAALTFVVVLAVVGGVSWALISSQQAPQFSIQERVRDEVMAYIKINHPETAQFMNDLAWAGGRATPQDILGAETFAYYSQGWNVTISYAVIANPAYAVAVDYLVPTENGVSIPYRVMWQGTWENCVITETSYTFAQ
ncbi:MAG: hypothetical protein NWE94_07485 [Candidatus Bathyarchaeota archaeon]|nr:hypothetical protein [Candidatus Bathyarchaeota archaeon]